jgi:gas vesicle protein
MHPITFIRGITIGFILGILFAPDSGAATRRRLARYASEVGEDIENALTDLVHGGREEQTESKAEEIMERNEPGYSNLTGYAGTL